MALDLTGLGSVANLGQSIIERIWPNKSDPAYITAQTALIQAQQAGAFKQIDDEFQLALEQIKTNAVEAASPNWFVAGWRPFVGWICGSGLGIQFLVRPFATWIAALCGHPIEFPSLDLSTLLTCLGGLLGLGTMRTVEKVQGAAGNH